VSLRKSRVFSIPIFVYIRSRRLGLNSCILSFSLVLTVTSFVSLQLRSKCSAVSFLPHLQRLFPARPILYKYALIYPCLGCEMGPHGDPSGLMDPPSGDPRYGWVLRI
jgi:hypothetical protein